MQKGKKEHLVRKVRFHKDSGNGKILTKKKTFEGVFFPFSISVSCGIKF